MNLTILFLSFLFNLLGTQPSPSGQDKTKATSDATVVVGAENFHEYLPQLEGKRVAMIVNQTSMAGNSHLVDTLLSLGIDVKKVFAPEHGFRGVADAGEDIKNDIDLKTQIPIISLYGSNYKPTPEQLEDVDVVIFDIQDVGVRFYTYISTMHYAMEACAENNKKFLVLDRPNPIGHYVDGPVLEPEFTSFVGMHPIPIVHGLTVGELARMINGEKWLKNGLTCDLEVVKVKNYDHNTTYSLPIKPSPNLPNDLSIVLYPSLCFFEGTAMSVGRGTTFPFQVVGHPLPEYGDFTFTPESIDGMAKNPKYENELCYGKDFRNESLDQLFTLSYLIDFYQLSPEKASFFTNYFNKLAGNATLQEQVKAGLNEHEIRQSWEPALGDYKRMRKNYLLYADFE